MAHCGVYRGMERGMGFSGGRDFDEQWT